MQTATGAHRLDSRLIRICWAQGAFAAGFLAIGVVLGAFFAHTLDGRISDSAMHNMETANRYHFYFCLVTLSAVVLSHLSGRRMFLTAGWFSLAGVFLFSGSLYLLSIRELLAVPTQILGPITPVGGVCFIIACVLLCVASIRMLKQ